MSRYERTTGPYLERRISRRALIAGGAAAAGLTMAWSLVKNRSPLEIPLALKDYLTEERLTDEQEEAARLLKTVPEEDFVHNIEATGQKDRDSHILDVNLRSRPAVPTVAGDFSMAGEDIGDLKPGSIIEKALVVEGPDPFSPWGSKEGRWFAFWDPQDPARAVFAFSGLFKHDLSFYKVKVHNVWH